MLLHDGVHRLSRTAHRECFTLVVLFCRLGRDRERPDESHSADTLQLLLSNRAGAPQPLQKGKHACIAVMCVTLSSANT